MRSWVRSVVRKAGAAVLAMSVAYVMSDHESGHAASVKTNTTAKKTTAKKTTAKKTTAKKNTTVARPLKSAPTTKPSRGLDAATISAARGEPLARIPASGEPYRIGFLLSRTSGDATIDAATAELQRGADLAVSFVNELGGIGGRPLALLVAEEGNTEDSARRGFTSLTDRSVYAVIGPTLSRHAAAVSPLAERSQTLLFGASTSANGIPALSPWVRRSAISPDVLARGVALELVASRLISTAVVAVAIDDPVGQAVARSYRRGFGDAGIRISALESPVTVGQADFGAVATEIATLSPDLVVVAGAPANTSALVAAVRQVAPRAAFLIDPTSLSAEFSKRCDPCTGVLTPVLYDPENPSAYSRAVLLRRYFDSFGSAPSLHAAQGFAAVQILAIALDAAVARRSAASASERRNLLRDQVGVGRYDTPLGLVEFDAEGEVKLDRIAVGEIVRSGDRMRVRALPSATAATSS